jgi:hypothetical protein
MSALTPGLLLALLLLVHPPRPLTVEQLRRRARARGLGSIDGRSLKYARRQQLVAALGAAGHG